MDFQKEDRKQVLEHTVEAFNPEDRHEAAQLVAQTLFSPMYKEIDLTEAKTDARFDSKLIQSLETEGISDYRILEKSDGTAELHFQVNSLEQYGRIQEQSGYAVRPVEVADYANSNVPTGGGSNGKGQNTKEIWEPSSYRAIVAETQLDTDVDPLEMQKLVDAEKDKFGRALAGSLHAPGFTVENMDRALGYANSYAWATRPPSSSTPTSSTCLTRTPNGRRNSPRCGWRPTSPSWTTRSGPWGTTTRTPQTGSNTSPKRSGTCIWTTSSKPWRTRTRPCSTSPATTPRTTRTSWPTRSVHGVGLVHLDGYQPPEFPPEGFTSRDDINGYVQQIENILER